MLNELVQMIYKICTAIVVYAIYVSIKNNIKERNESGKEKNQKDID